MTTKFHLSLWIASPVCLFANVTHNLQDYSFHELRASSARTDSFWSTSQKHQLLILKVSGTLTLSHQILRSTDNITSSTDHSNTGSSQPRSEKFGLLLISSWEYSDIRKSCSFPSILISIEQKLILSTSLEPSSTDFFRLSEAPALSHTDPKIDRVHDGFRARSRW